jgi:hypothetical protein
MESLARVSRGQNTDDFLFHENKNDLSPVIKVYIKSKSSERSLTQKQHPIRQKTRIFTYKSPLRQESKMKVAQVNFQEKTSRDSSPSGRITCSLTHRAKVQTTFRSNKSHLAVPSKSFKKLTRLYIRNHEIFNLIQNRKV